MFFLVISLASMITAALSSNVTQSRLPHIESGVALLYENTSIIPVNTETTFKILYSKTYTIPPTPFYFINHYKMKDKFVYENFYSYVKSADSDSWKIAVEPVATTSVMALSVSYIAVQNIYENFFVKEYTYGVEAGLASGMGSRSYTASYTFTQQFIGRTLSSDFSQNKLIVSWVGFWRSNSISQTLDMQVNSYFSNTSSYSIVISTSTSSGDWWNRTNVVACIINMEKFPSTVRFLSGSVVLSPSNTIKSWTEFEKFTNVSYCFGYTGINTNTNGIQDIYWEEHNDTTIQAHLSFLNYARYSYLILWNETVQAAPVDPVIDPVVPPVDPNNTNPVAPVDPIDPIPIPDKNSTPIPSPNPNPNPNNLVDVEQQSSSPIGIIIGVVVGILVIGVITVFLIHRYRNKKNHRVPIPQNLKEFHIFTPSFS